MLSPFHSPALSWAHTQGAVNPQVVDVMPEGPGQAIVTVSADSWTSDWPFTPDNPRDVRVELDGIGNGAFTPVGLTPKGM